MAGVAPQVRDAIHARGPVVAGRPRLRAAQLELETRAQAMRDEGRFDATELDYAVEWCENGGTLASLAEDMSQSPYVSVDIERAQVLRALHEKFGREEVTRRINEARPVSAHVLVEQAISIADKLSTTAEVSREDVARAKLQADVRTWAAQRWNPKELGDNGKGAGLTLNVQNLHLDALRSRNDHAFPLQATRLLDAGLGSTRPEGVGHTAPVTVVEAGAALNMPAAKKSRKHSRKTADPGNAGRHARTRSISE